MSHRMAVMHLPSNFCANSSIQFGVIDIFRNLRWRPPPSWIINLCEFGHSGVLAVRYLCSVPNLVQISVIVTEIDTHICFRPSFDDVTRINFRFQLLSSPHGLDASSHEIWCRYLYPILSYWYFFILDLFGWAMGPPTKPHFWCIPPVKILSRSTK